MTKIMYSLFWIIKTKWANRGVHISVDGDYPSATCNQLIALGSMFYFKCLKTKYIYMHCLSIIMKIFK